MAIYNYNAINEDYDYDYYDEEYYDDEYDDMLYEEYIDCIDESKNTRKYAEIMHRKGNEAAGNRDAYYHAADIASRLGKKDMAISLNQKGNREYTRGNEYAEREHIARSNGLSNMVKHRELYGERHSAPIHRIINDKLPDAYSGKRIAKQYF